MSTTRRTRWSALLSASALLAGGGMLVGPAAVAAEDPVVLAGSFQSEVGCDEDWQPTCLATALTANADGSGYSGTFSIPAGSYAFKVTEGGGWETNWGLGGVADGSDIPLVLGGDAEVTFTFDDATKIVDIRPAQEPSGTTRADSQLAQSSLRESLTQERYYFVMADRFANGDPSNDRGGLTGTRLVHGFDPTDKGFYHGGDLKGITNKLDYIEGLGTTAIWLTPSFKNRPVQGEGENASAGYHGYWITDFTQIDPHLGTNEDMKDLIDAAHARGMKVFFDIITNHTADIIDYREGQYSYRNKTNYPYKDAYGNVFDDRDYIGKPFPEMDPKTSFPYTPFFRTPEDATVKVPDWLNDPIMYHNRGDSTWAGESNTYGDFVGLDDLFTERPEVVEGMGEIYKAWVDFGIDGFRIDTVKHVNMEFWQEWVPDIMDHADAIGKDDFFMFGEVYDGNPEYLSTFTTEGKLQATLDFGFQANAVRWAESGSSQSLADFFAADDWYTDHDSNVYQTPTFLGNHDMGRVAMFLQDASANDDELLERVKLANSLMFFTRGQPVVYYGDEQGFIGSGGDKDSRQNMFATQVEQYATEKVLAAPSGSMDRYDTTHPLYAHKAALSAVVEDHPALADGPQIARYAADGPGVFAISRIDTARDREYLVVANNATTAQTATFTTWSMNENFKPLFGTKNKLKSNRQNTVTVTVPPLSVHVWGASAPLARQSAPPTVTLADPQVRGTFSGRTEIRAEVSSDTFVEATFLVRPVGTSEWTTIGVDDNAPFRVFHDDSAYADGTLLEYRVVVRDWRGQIGAAGASGIIGDPVAAPGADAEPAGIHPADAQPESVSIPGSLNAAMGCLGDWQPDCAQAQLTYDPASQLWSGTFTLPEGGWAYKVAINGSWEENYGAGGAKDGPNIELETDGSAVTFFYDHATHYVTSTAEGPIITAPGSFQSELGCAGDWMPDCMNPWLQDPEGDGTYVWAGYVAGGDYEFKVAYDRSWDLNYGLGGQDGADVSVTVPDGGVLTIVYDSETHAINATAEVP